jgi:hypothetical protein
MVVWLSAAMTSAPCSCWLALGADPLRTPTGPGGLGAGGVDGVGGPVVLPWLPDDRVAIVLPGVVDGHPDPEGEGGLARGEVAVADAVSPVSGDPELRIEPVEGLLGGKRWMDFGEVIGYGFAGPSFWVRRFVRDPDGNSVEALCRR